MLTKEQNERVDALVAERDELVAKLTKLNSFIYSGKADKLSDDARALLAEQHDVMEYYVRILNKRITQFIIDCVS